MVQTNPCIVNVYPPTKYEASVFISNRDMAKNPNSKTAATEKCDLGHSNPDMVNLYQHTKFEAKIFINDRYMAKNPKFNLAAAAILSFGKSGIWGHSILDMLMSISMPNLERIPSQMKEIWPKIQKRPPPS